MKKKSEGDNRLKCSFCGKSQDQVKKLIAGPGVYICDECVDLCNEILEDEAIAHYAPSSEEAVRLKSARKEIMQAALTRCDSWIVRRVADAKGIQVVIQDERLGTTLEEKVLYVSALEELVRDRHLSQCADGTYQVTWMGL